jgi:hypothetical protein
VRGHEQHRTQPCPRVADAIGGVLDPRLRVEQIAVA